MRITFCGMVSLCGRYEKQKPLFYRWWCGGRRVTRLTKKEEKEDFFVFGQINFH